MKYLKQMIPLQRAEEILRQHIQEKKPFSLIRINDGETRAIGYNIFINTKQLPGWYGTPALILPRKPCAVRSFAPSRRRTWSACPPDPPRPFVLWPRRS